MSRGARLTLFVLVGIALVGGGLYYFYKQNLKKLEAIKVKAKRVKVKASFKRINIKGDLELTNPSDLDFYINKYNINIYVQDVLVSNFRADQANITILPNSNVILPFSVDVDVAKFTQNLLSVVMAVFVNKTKSDPINIKFKGELSGKHGLIAVDNFPIAYIYAYKPEE